MKGSCNTNINQYCSTPSKQTKKTHPPSFPSRCLYEQHHWSGFPHMPPSLVSGRGLVTHHSFLLLTKCECVHLEHGNQPAVSKIVQKLISIIS